MILLHLFFLIFVCTSSVATNFHLLYSVNFGEGYFSGVMILYRVLMFAERLQSMGHSFTLVLPPICKGEHDLRHSDYLDVPFLAQQMNMSVVDFHEHSRVRARTQTATADDVDVAFHLSRRTSDLSQYFYKKLECDRLVHDDLRLTFLCLPLDVHQLRCFDMFSDMYEEGLLNDVSALFTETPSEATVAAASCDDTSNQLAQREETTFSVALLRAETLTWGAHFDDELFWNTQRKVRPADRLRKHADAALQALGTDKLCSLSYCLRNLDFGATTTCQTLQHSIHWRQNDFKFAHPNTPTADKLAPQISSLLYDNNDHTQCVFLMSDATREELQTLHQLLPQDISARVIVVEENSAAASPGPDLVSVEALLAIGVPGLFVGTEFSSVSYFISMTRTSLGRKTSDSTLLEGNEPRQE